MSDSYRQILRSCSIMGGAQAINYLVGLIRVKLVALLLGTSGVGLVGVYTSIIGVLGSLTGLGVASSGVRSVADAFGRNNAEEAARMVLVLRRACWFTGILGWIVAISLAVPISRWIAGSATHAWAIGLLGCTLLLGAISGGQLALLQGLRRIKDIAVVNVWSVAINSLLAVGLYLWLGERGILPVLIATSVTTLVLSHKFARRVQADLAYVTTYKDAQRAVSTLQALEILGRSLNVGNAFDQPLLKRFKDNLNNEDSLLVLGSAAYRSADQYLKNNASDDISVLVLTGGFIESLYLSTASPGALKDQGIADRIGEQKTTLNNLVDLIGAIDGQQEVGTLLTGLKELQVMFAGITLTYEYAEPVTDAAAKTTYINSTRTVTITGEQLNAIATKVTELRNTMLA